MQRNQGFTLSLVQATWLLGLILDLMCLRELPIELITVKRRLSLIPETNRPAIAAPTKAPRVLVTELDSALLGVSDLDEVCVLTVHSKKSPERLGDYGSYSG